MEKIQTTILMMFTLVASAVSGISHATIYDVTSVLDGSNTPGFNASSFHDSSGSNVMSGATLATISGTTLSGTYDDADGHLMVTMSVSNAGPTISVDGFLLFGLNGTLTADSTVSVDFAGSSGALSDTTIGFWGVNRVCCSGIYAPNSLEALGGDMIMTLWGANFEGSDFNGGYVGSTLGMDLVLAMTPQISDIPVPAALWLFGSGLLGLVGVARRKVS